MLLEHKGCQTFKPELVDSVCINAASDTFVSLLSTWVFTINKLFYKLCGVSVECLAGDERFDVGARGACR